MKSDEIKRGKDESTTKEKSNDLSIEDLLTMDEDAPKKKEEPKIEEKIEEEKEEEPKEVLTLPKPDEEDSNGKKKKKEKRPLRLGELIFLFVNILLIFVIVGFYAHRAYYYYKRENVDIFDTTKLIDIVTNVKNLAYNGDGLYQDEETKVYYYKGKEVNNNLYFQGRNWKIIEINDKNIKIVSNENITSLVYGINKPYEKSVVKGWLEDYLKTFKDQETYMVKSKWCNSAVDVKEYKCDPSLESYIGLLSIDEYQRAGGSNSYLALDEYSWTINYDKDNTAYYFNEKGQINNQVKELQNYFSFGVRPVITLSLENIYVKGNGTVEDPYVVGQENNVILRENYSGHYVIYKDMTFRILNTDETGTELILDGTLGSDSTYNNLDSVLTNDFLSTLDKKDLVKMDSSLNSYSYSNGYNYKDSYSKSNGYYRIPSIGDNYLVGYGNYWLNNIYNSGEGFIYVIEKNNTFYSDFRGNSHEVRPIIKIEPEKAVLSGKGTKEDPFTIEGENSEKQEGKETKEAKK